MEERTQENPQHAPDHCRRLNKYKARYAEAESRYGPKPNLQEAVEAYVGVAAEFGITPVELAIRWAAGGTKQLLLRPGCSVSVEVHVLSNKLDCQLPHPLPTVDAARRFVLSHPLVASAVVGATSLAQLDEILVAAERPWLEPELGAAVDAVHARYPNPTP